MSFDIDKFKERQKNFKVNNETLKRGLTCFSDLADRDSLDLSQMLQTFYHFIILDLLRDIDRETFSKQIDKSLTESIMFVQKYKETFKRSRL